MVARVAFSRSRPLMARYDVSAHMVKWWGKVRTDEGQVRLHLCVCGGGRYPTKEEYVVNSFSNTLYILFLSRPFAGNSPSFAL
jgi:hypothetical protein